MSKMLYLRTRIAVALVTALLLFAGSAMPQTVSGVISGTVVDSSGLPVVNATVTLINERTAERRVQTSNESGDFVFSAVLPGAYTIAVEMQGFKRVEKKNLNITAAERLPAGRFVLEVGNVTESVTVTAEGAAVQTMSQERSAVLTNDQMTTLMARGRDFLSLLRVLPGVIPPSDSDAIGRTGFTNIQGLRTTMSTVSMDGISSNDLGSMQAMASPMNMDAIGEVKVLLSNYQAEYGRTAGAVINAVTKSGTMDFHGGAYYYKRHEQFNANSFFNNRNKVAKPRYRYNTWGWNIGGPVFIPQEFNTNKDKLFFFFSQEILPTEVPGSLQQVTVPTELERAGDFSNTLDVSGKLVIINDPTSKSPFPNNKIPSGRINTNTQKLLSAFPLPNALDRTVTKGNYNYTFQEVRPERRTNEIFRIDANPSEKLRMYFRGSIYRQRQIGHQVAGGASSWGMLQSRFFYPADDGVFNMIYTINPTWINEFSLAGHHIQQVTRPENDADVQKLSRKALGINLPQFHPELNPLDLIPWASFGGVPSAASFSTDRRYPLKSADNVISFTDNMTKISGRHQIKGGIFVERVRYNGAAQGINFGSFDFSRDTSNPFDSNYAYSNALLGVFKSYQESTSRIGVLGRAWTVEWFLQDNWKVNRRLTLDLGVRFSWYTPYGSKDGKAAGFMPDVFSLAKAPRLYYPAINAQGQRVAFDPVTGQWAPALLIGAFVPNSGDTANGMVLDDGSKYDKGLMKRQGILPAPRIGFAYDLTGDGKTALRGGFGITYNTRERILLLDLVYNPPVQYNPTVYYSTVDQLLQSSGVLFPSSSGGLAYNGDTPRVYNYSLGIQRDIGFNTVVDVAYVATLGRNILQLRDINTLPYGARFQPQNQDPTKPGSPYPDSYFRPYPGYTSITIDEYGGSSNYHSLQVQANRRFTRGLQFGASWTYGKSMDYASNDWGSVSQYVNRRVWNYGPSDFDVTHVLTINWLWDVPKATNLVKNPVIGALFDNWRLSGIAMFTTGQPATPGFSTVDGADLTGGGDGIRMVLLKDPRLDKSQRTFDRWFDTTAFARPAKGTIGNMQRNLMRKPGTNNFDLSVFKEFPIKERARFQLRWEMYNAFNHTQYTNFNTSARFDAAGNQVNAAFGQITSTRTPRYCQASLRFMF